jgi:uncharacterized protein YacL
MSLEIKKNDMNDTNDTNDTNLSDINEISNVQDEILEVNEIVKINFESSHKIKSAKLKIRRKGKNE